MKLSERVEGITPSGSIKISEKITQLRANGKKIIGLNVGEPDFSSHPSV
ncbi:MAG: aspartate aminotransferase, partial [Halobacteriovorax sp.]|nr:aspartate aminotransferase [Halobacteriovorax sp.]